MSNTNRPKPVLLLILDGWGYSKKKQHNAIALAKTPHWDALMNTQACTLLNASGLSVGLPEGQMGNSEVGHLTLGAGRVIDQDLTRINQAIIDGHFFKNEVFLNAFKKATVYPKAVHILGLLSPGGIHSHENHIYALLKLAAQCHIKHCYLHVFIDGRDTPPKSAEAYICRLENQCARLGVGKIASLMGRYYAMDRDQRWERTQAAYNCLVDGKAPYQATTALDALKKAYRRGETDEFIKPVCIHAPNTLPIKISKNDLVIFMNFRADRARQLSRAFLDVDFNHFMRKKPMATENFISLTQYASDIFSQVAYPQPPVKKNLGEYLAEQGLTQLRIAETEKYAHITFFFNTGIETPYPHETRLLVPSKKVATYDLAPQMSALEITAQLLTAIESKKFDVIICNFANPDMLGHTGNLNATQEAITCIDDCIGKLITALQKQGGEAIITADHGNAECMYDEKTQQAHTAHTTEPVPFIYVGRPATIKQQMHNGTLADIAPTLLAILDLSKPKEMTGDNLLLFT